MTDLAESLGCFLGKMSYRIGRFFERVSEKFDETVSALKGKEKETEEDEVAVETAASADDSRTDTREETIKTEDTCTGRDYMPLLLSVFILCATALAMFSAGNIALGGHVAAAVGEVLLELIG